MTQPSKPADDILARAQKARAQKAAPRKLTPLHPIGYKTVVPEHLFIVAREQLDLFRYLAREFSSECDILVILDRRRGERRVRGERRATPRGDRRRRERRSQRDIRHQIRTLGYAFVRVR